jgi:predicted peptidase
MWHTPDILDKLEKLLDELNEADKIDSSRIYLTGWSMGGFGAMSLALRCPERIAALAVVSTGCYELQKISEKDNSKKEQILTPIKYLPIRVYYAVNDQAAVATKYTIPLITDLQRYCAGFEKVAPFTKDSDEEAHVMACQRTYSNIELYQWFLNFTLPELCKS